jgi:hypothetical protein
MEEKPVASIRLNGRTQLGSVLGAIAVVVTSFCLAVSPAQAALIFTEVMYNPQSAEPGWEWLEVYNLDASAVNLAGGVLDDPAGPVLGASNIASGTVPGHQTAILYNANVLLGTDFTAAWGSGINLIGVTSWSPINQSGDQIGLWTSFASYGSRDFENAEIDLTYGNGTGGWPTADGFASIYLAGGPLNVGSSWALSVSGLNDAYTSTLSGGNSGLDVGSPGTIQGLPEPSTSLLLGFGLAGLAILRRRRAQV